MSSQLSFANAVEHMASALAYARAEKGTALRSLQPFDRTQPMTRRYVDAIQGKQDADRAAMFSDVTPQALGEPVCYSLMSDVSEDSGEWFGYCCLALRALSFAQMRGHALPFASSAHCRITIAEVTRKGTFVGAERFCSWHPRERTWLTWGPHKPVRDEFSAHAQLVVGAQFTARYEWHVYLGLPKAPRLSIPCSASEARELFKARDLPPGAERRAALRHWVSEHFRNKGDEQPIAVRRHLRGATEFTWENLECSIVPARA